MSLHPVAARTGIPRVRAGTAEIAHTDTEDRAVKRQHDGFIEEDEALLLGAGGHAKTRSRIKTLNVVIFKDGGESLPHARGSEYRRYRSNHDENDRDPQQALSPFAQVPEKCAQDEHHAYDAGARLRHHIGNNEGAGAKGGKKTHRDARVKKRIIQAVRQHHNDRHREVIRAGIRSIYQGRESSGRLSGGAMQRVVYNGGEADYRCAQYADPDGDAK